MVNDIFDPNDVKDGKEYEKLSASEAKIEKEMERLRTEIDSLEEVKSNH